MKLLILNWKDPTAGNAGGAEEYMRRVGEFWSNQGHTIDMVVPRNAQQSPHETIGGVGYVHVGSHFSVFRHGRQFVRDHGADYDFVLESVSTRPFFVHEIAGQRAVAFYHQLANEVWSQEFRFPISALGRYVLEPRWLRRLKGARLVANSRSTASDLARYGLTAEAVIPPGCDPPPALAPRSPGAAARLLFIGRLVRTKRPGDALDAFDVVRRVHPAATLDVVGAGYLRGQLESRRTAGVTLHGFVPQQAKMEMLRRADLVLVPGTKEGWGIVAMEAAAWGVPVIAYNILGLRDAVLDGETGILTAAKPEAMAQAAIDLLGDVDRWRRLSAAAAARAREYTWDRAGADLLAAISHGGDGR